MNDPMVPGQAGIWETLLKDWTECLGSIEKDILRLEVGWRDRGLIDGLLGMIRRVKRGAAFVGAAGVVKAVHEMEAALTVMRDREIEPDAELIDLLLASAEAAGDGCAALGAALRGQALPGGAEWFALPPDAEAKWSGIVPKLQAWLGRRWPAAQGAVNGAADGGADDGANGLDGGGARMAGPDPEEHPDAAKERLAGEIYGQLDRMAECAAQLERDANDRGALMALASAAHAMKTGLERLASVLPADGGERTAVRGMLRVAHPLAQWLETSGTGGRPLAKERLGLCREACDYVKSALESALWGDGAASPDEALEDRLRAALAESAAPAAVSPSASSGPFSASNASAGEPAQKAAMSQSIRVSQDKLDKMMNTISELLIAKNAFMHLSAKLNTEYDLPELSKEMKEVGFSVNRIADELQNAIMSIRMVEIRTVFQKMPRIVRDVAQLTGKKMELVMAGETTEIDKTIVEQISDPLVHLIRNAADHGIESPEERLRKGKSETGRIELRAYNKDKHVCIEIGDDGKGIDPEALKRKALEKGLIAPEQADRMSRSQLINLIFLPGFSTARQITGVSGRGVGMDIVRSNIEKINGTVSIDSEVDKGTRVVIRLPLTLAISRGLIVDAAEESYIIPIEYISETVKIRREEIHELGGKYFTAHKGEVIGNDWLALLFLSGEVSPDGKDEFHAVILESGGEKFGLIVDKLRSEQEFVIKPLYGQLAGIPGISGSTLLGDGQVVLIVNPPDLAQLAKNG